MTAQSTARAFGRILLHATASATPDSLAEKIAAAIAPASGATPPKTPRWVRPLCRRFLTHFAEQTRPRLRDIISFLLADDGFQRTRARHVQQLSVRHWLPETPEMQPVAAAREWDLPQLTTTSGLASWLQLSPAELDWFADRKRFLFHPTDSPLRHYRYRAVPKHSGGVRLIEAPKPRLKQLQRTILDAILNRVPAHPAAHGFVAGRSIRSFVAPHAAQRVVLRMDLQDFFPSISAARVQAVFRTLGYPEEVADTLTALCIHAAPRDAFPAQARAELEHYTRPHLPQGAPTSPALANICAYRLDCRLSALAASAGAIYTRYADDLAFSGGDRFDRSVSRFATHTAALVWEEGFAIHHRKTRIMRPGVRQHLAGLVVNQHPNVMRRDFDRLKAILTNCARTGPVPQNRDQHPDFRAHLLGRISFVASIHPERGRRLQQQFQRIAWEPTDSDGEGR
jgi:hypothetical protein